MPQIQPDSDKLWMVQALDLARRMRGHAWPNPPVGCVIVKDGVLIAQGATRPGGRPHAERVALDHAGAAAAGATLFVTLEPCCHHGKTPPCAEAIIEAGITRVVAALQDPDPRVNGGGFRRLRAAGITVDIGIGAAQAAAIMSGFVHRTQTGRPEQIVLDDLAQSVPEGADALIVSRRGQPALVLRSGHSAGPDLTLDAPLLTQLGAFGLTSVAIWRGDAAMALMT